MAEDLSPSDIRARKFTTVRRGFDRAEVTSFQSHVSDRVEALEGELAAFSTRLNQLGITDLVDLKEEIEDVGLEIQTILDAAMAAAEGLRARAADAAEDKLAEASQSAFSLREDAWVAGMAVLDDAGSQASRTLAEAREDALFIRAQAEQDAKQLVTQARRDADDMLRSSREEGERIVVTARAEGESILEEAILAAEKAQERARALENRRAELLNELQEAESAARDVDAPRTEPGAELDRAVRVVANGIEDRTRWPEDDGAVRILPAATAESVEPEPVDAEAMAAEVAMMRSAVTMPQRDESSKESEAVDESESEQPSAPAEAGRVEDKGVVPEPEKSPPASAEEVEHTAPGEAPEEPEDTARVEIPDESRDRIEAPDEEAPDEEAPDEEAPDEEAPDEEAPDKEAPDKEAPDKEAPDKEAPDKEAGAAGSAQNEEPAPVVEDKVTFVENDPGIDDLFAKLRRSVGDAASSVPKPEEGAAAGAVDEPMSEPVHDPVEGMKAPAQSAPPPVLHVVPDIEPRGDFERRDRMLLPIENRGLRGLKRRIVELQNRVLEELRRAPGEWRLGREHVATVMGEELDAVLIDSFQAGHSMAAETMGKAEPQLIGGPKQGAAEVFTHDLHRDVQSVIERGDPGSRRMAADVSRVFRNWRTDEAERHVRAAARRAFNDGLLAGYKRLGAGAVEIVEQRRPCGECSAGTGVSWDPAEAPPSGVEVPPVGPRCAGLVVPIVSNGSVSRPAQ